MNSSPGGPGAPDGLVGLDDLRPLMFSIAYRMTGSVGDAEDIVQEAVIRTYRAARQGTMVESLKAFVTTTTTRLAIDHLRSARVQREAYVGTWLPEPLLSDPAPGPAERAEMSDSLSLAFLVLLESLSPVERAVFLLREVFGYDYGEIAEAVGKSEPNCRQIFTRARRHIDEGRPRFEASRRQGTELTELFLAALSGGDIEAFIDLLAPDVTMYGDGGGKAPAASAPVHGRERVARLLRGLARQAEKWIADVRPAQVNGQPGIIAYDRDGNLFGVIAFEYADGQVQAIRSQINPDKLRHLR
ncbi:MAG TPA: RNA polymerase sigma-70 factor [Streptosporangiaceae bacterium]|nr:RNA polymerase sigma-70 factor [Streptosporangiaceae bacterium]